MQYFSEQLRIGATMHIARLILQIGVLTTIQVTGPAFGQSTSVPRTVEIKVDAPSIRKFSPYANPLLVDAIVKNWSVARNAGIVGERRIQHFFTQIATETGGLRLVEENLNYSAERLIKVFPNRVSEDQAKSLAYKPIDIANHVYNNRLGNLPPMDGWNFRGSGLIQLTGRKNFFERAQELQIPLVEKPDLARLPENAFTIAVAFWTSRNINTAADNDDVVAARKLVNGGTNGLPESKIWLSLARKVFQDPNAVQKSDTDEPDEAAIRDVLQFLGYGADKADDPKKTERLLEEFQRERGLTSTGRVDAATLYELTEPGNFKGLE